MTVEQLARELGLEEILMAAAEAEDHLVERDEDFTTTRDAPMVRGELVA